MKFFFKKLGKALNYIFLCKFYYTKPDQKKYLIFDSELSEHLLKNLENSNTFVLDVRPWEKDNKINLYVLFKMFCTFNISLKKYIEIYIKEIKPKIILTLIDNSILFYQIKNLYPSAKTILVQNAWRGAHRDIFKDRNLTENKKSYRCDYIVCFNKHIGKLYKSFLKGKIIVNGSYRSNEIKIKKLKKPNKYLYVSVFREAKGVKTSPEDIVLLKVINNYFYKTKKKLVVLGNSALFHKEELNFYKNHFKNINFKFIPNSTNRKTYEIIDSSNLIISLESTLVYEALSRGKKVINFSMRTNEIPSWGHEFGWPAPKELNGPFWTTRVDYDELKNKIIYLENLKSKDFQKILNKHVKDLLPYSYGNFKFNKLIQSIS